MDPVVVASISIVLLALGTTLFFTSRGNSTLLCVATVVFGAILGAYALAISIST